MDRVVALLRSVLLAVAAPALGGCYLLTQASGQLDILIHSKSVNDMLADPSVPDPAKEKLRLVLEIKSFGEREMGLTPSTNYTTFYDTAGRPITYIVTACAKDSFRPHTWWFPIIGDVPYKGFFHREDAIAEARALRQAGYDVSLGTAAAYSTLGYFKDPILSTMLDYTEEQLASLILHELTHGTIYLPGGAEFNEGLASFVGWQGALEFARRTHGPASVQYDRTIRAYADEQARDDRASRLFEALDRLYRSSASHQEKLEERERIYLAHRSAVAKEVEAARREADERIRAGGLGDGERSALMERLRELRAQIPEGPVNNAIVLNQRRYGRYEEFRKRFERANGDWRTFLRQLREPGPG